MRHGPLLNGEAHRRPAEGEALLEELRRVRFDVREEGEGDLDFQRVVAAEDAA